MKICITPKSVFLSLFVIIIIFTLASLVLNMIRIYTGHETVFGLLNLLDLDTESNLPTLFSVFLLAVACIALSVIAADHKRCGKAFLHWFWLAVVFGFLACDEGAQIHEVFGDKARQFIRQPDNFILGWVVPYGIFVIIIIMAYFRFWLHLDYSVRVMIAIAGALYVGGAIGCDFLESYDYLKYGYESGSLQYTLLVTLEEFMEMMGIAVFLYALLRYIEMNSICVTLWCRYSSANVQE